MSNPQPNPNQLDPKFQLQAEQKLSINFPHYLKLFTAFMSLYSIRLTIQMAQYRNNQDSRLNPALVCSLLSWSLVFLFIVVNILYEKLKKFRPVLKIISTTLALLATIFVIEAEFFWGSEANEKLDLGDIARTFFIGYIISFIIGTFITFYSDWRVQCVMFIVNYLYVIIRFYCHDPGWQLGLLIGMLILMNFLIYLRQKDRLVLVQEIFKTANHDVECENLVKTYLKTPLVIFDKKMTLEFCSNEFISKFGLSDCEDFNSSQKILRIFNSTKISFPGSENLNESFDELMKIQNSALNSEGELQAKQSLLDLLSSSYLFRANLIELTIPNAVIHTKNEDLQVHIHIQTIPWKQQTCQLITFHDNTTNLLNSKLQSLNSYKDSLIATVSHDLRSPLNSIVGTIQAIEMDLDFPTHLKEELEIAKCGCSFLILLANDLLDFCQLKDGKLRLAFENVEIPKLIKETLALLKLQAATKEISLRFELEDGVPEILQTDPNRLKQILINLLTNAIKFTSAGFVKVLLRKVSFQEHSFVEFSIQDSGIGIKKDDIPKLFKRYGRIEHDDHEINKNGIGLGLNICQDLLKRLNPYSNNNFVVESEFGKGAIFLFYLPIENDLLYSQYVNANISEKLRINSEINLELSDSHIFSENKDEILIRSSQKIISGSPRLKQLRLLDSMQITSPNNLSIEGISSVRPFLRSHEKRQIEVLVVDDNAYNVAAMRIILEKLGYKVTGVFDGQNAIRELTSSPFKYDFVLLDCNMPGLDGAQTARIIKEKAKTGEITDVPIIGVTGVVTTKEHLHYREAGMSEVLVKPITKELIERKLRDMQVSSA